MNTMDKRSNLPLKSVNYVDKKFCIICSYLNSFHQSWLSASHVASNETQLA
jgi:hypothetical protein